MRIQAVIVAVTLALLAASGGASAASEPIGKALRATQTINATGDAGTRVLASNGEVFFLDRITSNSSGSGEFEFNDGTKLAVGPSANVVVDQFVVGDNSSFQKLGISATKGAFRWISGSSPSSAYHIQTPLGTMGIRGTAFDLTVQDGRTYILLLNGNATFCGQSTSPNVKLCQTLSQACDYVVADGPSVSEKKPVSAAFKNLHDAEKLFPFSANPDRLSQRFRVAGSSCLRIVKAQLDNQGHDNGPGGGSGGGGGGGSGGGGACSSADKAQAKQLAAQVQALSKTDPAAALQVAEGVARSKPACFQTAFGEFLNGTGTASIGAPGPTGDTGGWDHDTGSNDILRAPSPG